MGIIKNRFYGIEDCCLIVDDDELKYHNKKKLIKCLYEFQTYIENNSHLIVNYGEKW